MFFVLGLAALSGRWFRCAAAYGIIASVLGLTTWFMNSFSRPHDIHVMIGYYFWQASHLVIAFGAMRIIRLRGLSPQVVGKDEINESVEEITRRR